MRTFTTSNNDEVRLENIKCQKCNQDIRDFDNLTIRPKTNTIKYICFLCGWMGSMECEVRDENVEIVTTKKITIVTQKDSQTQRDHAEESK